MPDPNEELKKAIKEYDSGKEITYSSPINKSIVDSDAGGYYEDLGRQESVIDFDVSSLNQTRGQRYETQSEVNSMGSNMWNSFMNSIDEIDESRYKGEKLEKIKSLYELEQEVYGFSQQDPDDPQTSKAINEKKEDRRFTVGNSRAR